MVEIGQIEFIGNDLHRPECVMTAPNGSVHVADWRGGVTVIAGDGSQRTVLAEGARRPRPNGIAILPDDGWLLAHLGEADGGVYPLSADGQITKILGQVGDEPLPSTNYVHVDHRGRIWVTVSTRALPRSLGYRLDCADGFIVLSDASGARIVAGGLGYTNECAVHPETGQLYVNETFARRLTRFDVASDGSLGNRTTVAEFGPGIFPDGLTFDADGGPDLRTVYLGCLLGDAIATLRSPIPGLAPNHWSAADRARVRSA